MKRLYLSVLVIILFISCTQFNEYEQLENKATQKIGMLKFQSKRDLWYAINGDKATSKSILDATIVQLADSLRFISLTDAIPISIAAQDPILGVEGMKANIVWEEKGILYPRKPIYKILGYDTLIPNRSFARLLNARGEIAVNDTIYKVSSRGTYFYEQSLQTTFEENYNFYESIQGTLINDNLTQIDEGIFRYNTFTDIQYEYSNNNIPEQLPSEPTDNYTSQDPWTEPNMNNNINPDINSEEIYYLYNTGNNRTENIPWRDFQVYEAEAHTILGKFWESLIGRNITFTDQLSSKRRVKGKFQYYNYVVYSEIATFVQMQKKNWIGWSGTRADKLFLGWNNILFENSYETIPSYPQNPVIKVTDVSYKSIPGLQGQANIMTIVGLEITDQLQQYLSALLPNQLNSWLNIRVSNYRNNYNISQIDVIQFYSANKVVTLLTNGYLCIENQEKLKHTFLKDWGFSIQLNLLDMPNNMIEWAQTLNAKELLIKPKNLKYGAVYLAGKLDGHWGGMTITKD